MNGRPHMPRGPRKLPMKMPGQGQRKPMHWPYHHCWYHDDWYDHDWYEYDYDWYEPEYDWDYSDMSMGAVRSPKQPSAQQAYQKGFSDGVKYAKNRTSAEVESATDPEAKE